jgi:N-acetylmuramoyl-L-alanine amidase
MNASRNARAHGVETYIYGYTASNKQAAALAARENEGVSAKDLVLNDLRAHAHELESLKVAENVLAQLLNVNRMRHIGVKRMPFYVIAKTEMPSILVEVAFITNAEEEKKLRSSWWRRNVAKLISQGIIESKSLLLKKGGQSKKANFLLTRKLSASII